VMVDGLGGRRGLYGGPGTPVGEDSRRRSKHVATEVVDGSGDFAGYPARPIFGALLIVVGWIAPLVCSLDLQSAFFCGVSTL